MCIAGQLAEFGRVPSKIMRTHMFEHLEPRLARIKLDGDANGSQRRFEKLSKNFPFIDVEVFVVSVVPWASLSHHCSG